MAARLKKEAIYILIGISIVITTGLGFLIFKDLFSNKVSKEVEKEQKNILLEIPEALSDSTMPSKTEAYKFENPKADSYDDYYRNLVSENNTPVITEEQPEESEENKHTEGIYVTPWSGSGSDVKKRKESDEDIVNRVFGKPGNEEEKEPEENKGQTDYESLASIIASSNAKNQEDVMQILRNYGIVDTTSKVKTEKKTEQNNDNRIDLSSYTEVEGNDGIVSRLEESSNININLSGDEKVIKPIRAVFLRDEIITDGQRVTIRTLNDATINGVKIPKNTHLSANCNISDRLRLHISNIEYNGQIYRINLSAYDVDGNEGIYCPETAENTIGRDISKSALSTAGSIVSSYLGVVGGAITQNGMSAVEKKKGRTSVNISSGYEFYLSIKH